jgi:hypothetical protein
MLDRFNVSELETDAEERSADAWTDDRGWMLCGVCGNPVTPVAARAELGGRHLHRRVNPGGIEFEFGIFALAPGCRESGSPIAKDSWFDSYAWEIAVCSRCAEHLGWRFSGGENRSVYGLIVAKLVAHGDQGINV